MTIGAIVEGKGTEVVSVDIEARVRDAVSLLAARRIGAMPVLDNGRVAGIISERDVITCLESHGAAVLDMPVREVMTAPAITVTREVRVLSALSQMTHRRIRHLPVVEDDRLIAIVSIGDLVKHRIEKIEQEAEAMRSYIQSA